MIFQPQFVYPLLLVAGFGGLISMLVMGAVHFGQGHGQHGHGHAQGHGEAHGAHGLGHGHGMGHGNGAAHGHVHGGHAHAAHGHAAHGPAAHHGHGAGAHHGQHDNPNADGDGDGDGGSSQSGLLWLLPLLSPLTWFSWFLGAGLVGTVLAGRVGEPWRALLAVAGALLFRLLVVKPIWNAMFQFAGRPAGNLEACLLQTAEAVTAFNERGEGLVRLTIDGRCEDVLARLTSQELAQGGRVRRGELVMVEEVDPATNTCRVSRA